MNGAWKWLAVLSMSVGAAYGLTEMHASQGAHASMVTQEQVQSVERRLDRIEDRIADIQRFLRNGR